MKKLLIALILTESLFTNSIADTKIKIFTEHYPTHNMKVAGHLTGRSVEILDAMFKQMKSKQSIKEIKLTNWSRAYSVAQKIPNSMVFSTARVDFRENLFKWVGPIYKTKTGLIAHKSKKIVIDSISDLNNYKINTILRDVSEQVLLKRGVDKKNIRHIDAKDAISQSFKKMASGNIDMFAYNIDIAFNNAKKMGFDTAEYEVVYKIANSELFYAFNKKTDDKIIQKWQKALDTIKENGIYDKIINKYK